ncbi:HlyD family efflux transporter periplasmic adaptor subunit [Actimicrobium sp. CCI2.3]|uniref:HlyD family efflux transporter periplasmic adaptor subunit n=1 Tax=Actimicrobium sp. CCI2.3 TaxID=3048616 RepID=UPI002AB3CB6C|nr:HlyD family efflux transporter periplasmic adaptor subunit [Actimicrobium sp. CCI2.3]MDY7575085.1 HlyD family efflux transporter periplasmic adaptor subunit [Actimicrobium sp. CCI2.3]MEB0022574.1 HlyD family efflux transporter periplasmic adaptor subunit [Actimicrobium sp. CCI2.3]
MDLPVLREEIALFAGPTLADGQPSWTLHDPVRNQFFRIDWMTFEILARWSASTLTTMLASLHAETTLRPDTDDIAAVATFLRDNQLVQVGGTDSAVQLAGRQARLRGSWQQWLLHHYLFFRVPLLRPDGWLTRSAALAAPLYTRAFAQLTLLALALGLVMVYRDWTHFSATLLDTFTPASVVSLGLAVVFVKVLHELGHAFTAKRYGCRVPVMGVAFLVLLPMAYTDTNEVWKLANRKQRLIVAGAGIATEIGVAIWATLAWCLLPEGVPKSIAFLLATTTWIATVAINASPFMRFDGYFLLSDWLDMPNLHGRSFALARWKLRGWLFGLTAEPPEYFSRRRTAGLIAFAWATWIYRLVLFLGIAALVYHFVVKAIGILLFIIEIGWFIVLPLWHEIRHWPALLRKDGASGPTPSRVRRTALLLGLLVVLAVVPWPARLSASGMLKPAVMLPIHAPAGAQLTRLPWHEGSVVPAGAVLLELASAELPLRWRKAQARVTQLHQQNADAAVDAEQRQNLQVLQQEQASALAELASIEAELALYAPSAPFDGVLRNIDPELVPGVWVSQHERLAVLVQPGTWQVDTYLDEDDVQRIAIGDHARFYTDGLAGPVLHLTVSAIEPDATRTLQATQLAAQFGGSVLTRDKRGTQVPERAVYRVMLTTGDDPASLSQQSWRGRVVIHGKWEAPVVAFLRAGLVLVWRELGF